MENKNKQSDCAFFDAEDEKGCRALKENICSVRKCTFYMTREQYEENMNTDFLLLSYQKGKISLERYRELADNYHGGKRAVK